MIVLNRNNTYAPIVVVAKLGALRADASRFVYGLPEASEQFSVISLLYIFTFSTNSLLETCRVLLITCYSLLPEASEQFSYFSGNGKLLYMFLCFLYYRDH